MSAITRSPLRALYNVILPLLKSETKRPAPDIAMAVGVPAPPSSVMKVALITAPVVALYVPIVPDVVLVTKSVLSSGSTELSGIKRSEAPLNGRVMKLALITIPLLALYLPIEVPLMRNSEAPDTASPLAPLTVIKLGLMTAPDEL